ncbi:MAG: membrane-bound lytic murein transglycosylase B [Paracoccaceae bacterium]|jgi:membrane-bound lytic murein transglycosylase B
MADAVFQGFVQSGFHAKQVEKKSSKGFHMRKLLGLVSVLTALSAGLTAHASTSVESLDKRPKARPVEAVATEIRVASSNARFDLWVKAFRPKALAKGISAKTYDRAFSGVNYDPSVIEKDRNQSEFTKQIWDYLDTATSETRVRNGKKALSKHRNLLKKIEKTYGVDHKVVLAIWGLESAYGAQKGSRGVIESLATLAYDGRRSKFFQAQLIAALQIIQAGDIRANEMKGSWAGAMGHTQFIPTSYLGFAQDFRGDGRRNIWEDDPADALASTANYLKKHGWVHGQPWGLEVRLPGGFDYSQTSERVKKPVASWRAMGVTTIDGARIPDHGTSSILLPAGSKGAAFIIFKNFQVIERYNTADAYIIAVGHLGDRIAGGDVIQAKWPRGEKALSFKQKKQMQRLLRRRGIKMEKIDGIVGPDTIAAIRAFQTAIGVKPDGYATTDLLTQLKKNKQKINN